MSYTERQEIDRLQQRCAKLQSDLSRMTKRAKLYKAAVKRLDIELQQSLQDAERLTEKCKELALDASACEVMCDQARSQRDRAIAACERQAASHESTVAMLRAGQERTRLILREGLHACLGPRCLCKTGDCAKSDACPYGRTTAKETTK